jgi:enterochelin esterase family protein
MLVTGLSLGPLVSAQQGAAPPAAGGRGGAQAPPVVSPEVMPDRTVVFRILAPRAQAVRVVGSDMPALAGGGRGAAAATPPPGAMTKAENGVWSVTIGPIDPGAYRYNFNVDGVTVIDPRNSSISESNTNVWSLFYVPGSDLMDTKQVPHGAVSAVTYYSTALGRFRRVHVYTPPGYETGGAQKYPILYLLHGSGDCDEAWTSVGRAGFILDNLIAAKQAKPMIVVMPAGHTNSPTAGDRGSAPTAPAASSGPPSPMDDFARDFLTDVMPYAEAHYRVISDRSHRAIAGLSMGGSQTLNIAFLRLQQFAYIGVFSSGASLGSGRGAAPAASAAPAAAPATPPGPSAWETAHAGNLDESSLKKGTKLVWLSTGANDSLLPNTRSTVEILKKHGFDPVFKESPGGHTWINWRNYLGEFAPLLFR